MARQRLSDPLNNPLTKASAPVSGNSVFLTDDAVRSKASADASALSAADAAAQAGAALTQAGNAAGSASAAASSASAAAGSASAASTSASNAAATLAASALKANNLSDLASAATARTNLNVYSKTETDTQDALRLAKASNLSDLASAATARTNLGISTVGNTGAYADLTGKPTLSTVAGTGAYSDLTGKPSLGDAAAKNTGTTTGTLAAGDDSRLTGAVRSDVAQTLTTTQQAQGRENIAAMGLNRIINGDFRINQRAYASGGALAAGAFGHDRWKAGSGGCTYTFTQLKAATVITLTAGSLIQPIEDVMVDIGGTWVLSWQGTATARIGINGATATGSYAASPIIVTGVTAGQQCNIEFTGGTLDRVQFEPSSLSAPKATPFERIPYGAQEFLCRRYGQLVSLLLTTTGAFVQQTPFSPPMRATPTLGTPTFDGGTGATFNAPGPRHLYQTANHSIAASATIFASAEI